jgi:pyruvate dehydrogenase complex dehydrogenase (E1) component
MNLASVTQANRAYDADPEETAEWLTALESVVRAAGEERAEFILSALARKATELSRFHLVNQQIGFLRFSACADSQGEWHGGKVFGCGEP